MRLKLASAQSLLHSSADRCTGKMATHAARQEVSEGKEAGAVSSCPSLGHASTPFAAFQAIHRLIEQGGSQPASPAPGWYAAMYTCCTISVHCADLSIPERASQSMCPGRCKASFALLVRPDLASFENQCRLKPCRACIDTS